MGEPVRPPPTASREFDVDGDAWVAEISGAAAIGGSGGSVIECVHFRRKAASGETALRNYLPRGRFALLDDAELRELRSLSGPIQPPPVHDADADPESPPGRKRAVVEYPEPDGD